MGNHRQVCLVGALGLEVKLTLEDQSWAAQGEKWIGEKMRDQLEAVAPVQPRLLEGRSGWQRDDKHLASPALVAAIGHWKS